MVYHFYWLDKVQISKAIKKSFWHLEVSPCHGVTSSFFQKKPFQRRIQSSVYLKNNVNKAIFEVLLQYLLTTLIILLPNLEIFCQSYLYLRELNILQIYFRIILPRLSIEYYQISLLILFWNSYICILCICRVSSEEVIYLLLSIPQRS